MATGLTIISDAGAGDLAAIREMLHEYRDWLKVDLCFQQFDAEVQALPWQYEPPRGALLIARSGGTPVGMVALRPRDDDRCEMKRLFVRDDARGSGLGRQLVERIIAEARARGYREMILDTLPIMQSAQRLYESFGFRDIAPYYDSPIAGTRYMALRL
jgi:ribosomal protein S18 acetylase RimI-like enzyme